MSESASPLSSADGHSAYLACAIDEAGRALSSFEVEAADDAEAMWLANAFSELGPVTLWQGERFLGRFGGPMQAPAAPQAHTVR